MNHACRKISSVFQSDRRGERRHRRRLYALPLQGEAVCTALFLPKDFTLVCPTELWGFQKALPEFEARETAVVACSTDSEFSHWAWAHMPQDKGGIEGVTYPLISDINKEIAELFDVLAGDKVCDEEGFCRYIGERVAYRGLFLLDKGGIIRHMVVNDMPLGRSVKEALRMVDALQHWERHGEVCPLDWESSDK